jgi:hypothetical protein
LGTPEGEKKDAVPEPQLLSTLVNKHIVNIVAGDNHSMAMDITGQIWTWGCNKYGQVSLHVLLLLSISAGIGGDWFLFFYAAKSKGDELCFTDRLWFQPFCCLNEYAGILDTSDSLRKRTLFMGPRAARPTWKRRVTKLRGASVD